MVVPEAIRWISLRFPDFLTVRTSSQTLAKANFWINFRKDIIKIDADIELNTDILGYIDPDVTINVIKDGKIAEKKTFISGKSDKLFIISP